MSRGDPWGHSHESRHGAFALALSHPRTSPASRSPGLSGDCFLRRCSVPAGVFAPRDAADGDADRVVEVIWGILRPCVGVLRRRGRVNIPLCSLPLLPVWTLYLGALVSGQGALGRSSPTTHEHAHHPSSQSVGTPSAPRPAPRIPDPVARRRRTRRGLLPRFDASRCRQDARFSACPPCLSAPGAHARTFPSLAGMPLRALRPGSGSGSWAARRPHLHAPPWISCPVASPARHGSQRRIIPSRGLSRNLPRRSKPGAYQACSVVAPRMSQPEQSPLHGPELQRLGVPSAPAASPLPSSRE